MYVQFLTWSTSSVVEIIPVVFTPNKKHQCSRLFIQTLLLNILWLRFCWLYFYLHLSRLNCDLQNNTTASVSTHPWPRRSSLFYTLRTVLFFKQRCYWATTSFSYDLLQMQLFGVGLFFKDKQVEDIPLVRVGNCDGHFTCL